MAINDNLRDKLHLLKQDFSSRFVEQSAAAKQRALQFIEEGLPPDQKLAFLAKVNGMVGDQLHHKQSPLALSMVFTDQRQILSTHPALLASQLPGASSRIVLYVHGWCMADTGWQRKGHKPDQLLAAAGYTAVFLRYNTGHHISQNGEELATALEALIRAWPCEVTELVIVGHSMGGLVTRSACYYAEQCNYQWLHRLQTFVTLGTPHNGAPLARLASWIDEQAATTPSLSFLQKLGEIRSSGTKDLSRGLIVHEDWLHTDKSPSHDAMQTRPRLPDQVHCFAVASCLGKNLHDEKNRRLGDGLVPVPSALGESEQGMPALNYADHGKWVGAGIHHIDLICHPTVMAQIRQWVLTHTL